MLVPGRVVAQDQDPHALFFEANKLYKEGAWAHARGLYEDISRDPEAGAAVFLNLGNCYLRDNRLGPAILNYERARLLKPRDPDLDFNLGIARDRRQDKAEKQDEFMAWLSYFTGSEFFWAFAAANALFCLALLARLWRPREWTFYALMALGILWAMTGFFGTVKWYAVAHDDRAVVVASKISVRAGPGENDTLLFKLHAGTVVDCQRVEDGWSLIRFSDDKRGWTPVSGVMPIRPINRPLPGRT